MTVWCLLVIMIAPVSGRMTSRNCNNRDCRDDNDDCRNGVRDLNVVLGEARMGKWFLLVS